MKRRFPDLPKWWTAKTPPNPRLLGHLGEESLTGQDEHPIIWLVEGASDYLATVHLMTVGNDRHPVVAALGATRLTDTATMLIPQTIMLVIIADGDKVGWRQAAAAKKAAGEVADLDRQDVIMLTPPAGEDLGSLVRRTEPGKVLHDISTAALEALDRDEGIAKIVA